VQDGAEWLQGLVDVLRADAMRILDFPHAIEHLTAASQSALGIGTPEVKAWLDEQAHTLKGLRHALSACTRRSTGGTADGRLRQSLAGGLATHQRTSSD
jgi:hypothetical protein